MITYQLIYLQSETLYHYDKSKLCHCTFCVVGIVYHKVVDKDLQGEVDTGRGFRESKGYDVEVALYHTAAWYERGWYIGDHVRTGISLTDTTTVVLETTTLIDASEAITMFSCKMCKSK